MNEPIESDPDPMAYSVDTRDSRVIRQYRQWRLNSYPLSGLSPATVVAADFEDAKRKYHAAIVAVDAGLIKKVTVTSVWRAVYASTAGVEVAADLLT